MIVPLDGAHILTTAKIVVKLMEATETPRGSLQYLVLIVGVFAISSSAIFIRLAQDAEVPSLVIASWRTLLASLFLLPFALARRRQELAHMRGGDWRLALLAGVLLGLHFATWISSLAFTTITSSTVLVATAPLWVGLASPFLLGESLSRGLKVGILLALLGTLVIGLGDLLQVVDGRIAFNLARDDASQPLLGNLLALAGGFTAAGYLLIGRRLRQSLSLLSYTAVVYGMAAITLLVLALASGVSLFGYSPTAYLLFLAMALFPQLIGHSSFNWALSFLPAAFVSVATISEPVGATILAIMLFGELPGPLVVVGSMLILAGVLRATRRT